MKKLVAMLVCFIMVAALMAACAAPAENAAQGSANSAAGKIKIGFSFPTKNNEFWTKSLSFVNYAATQLGVEVVAQDCDNKQEKQVSDVENMIANGIQGLVLAPQDASVCPGIIKECNTKNIPVMIADRWPGDDLKAGTDYLGFIGPNDEQAGYDIAMALIKAGCKNLVGLGGFSGTSVAEGRKKGLEKAITEHPDVKLLQYEAVGENMDQGDKAMRNMLQSFSNIDGVWCYNDSLALATVNILKEKSMLSKIKVGGMDLLDPAVKSIDAGELYFSTGGHWMQTGFALIMVYDAINGVKPTETVIKLNLLAVTKDNLPKYKAKYVDNATPVDVKALSRKFNPNAKTYFELSLN